MNVMRNLLVVLLCSLAMVFPLACNKSQSGGNKKLTIAVIPKGTTHEFWLSVKAGAEKAGKELGVDIIWQGPEKEDDRQQQIAVVENMVLREVSGIVLAPLDRKAMVAPVSQAMSRKIPVVIIDSGLDGNDYTSFVATDNYKGGVLGGEQTARVIDGKGKVIMLRYQENSASTEERERGWMDAIKKNPGITVESENQRAGATKESAQTAAENLVDRFKGDNKMTIDAIFCPNESSAYGMLMALRSKGLAGKVKYVGFDASKNLIQGLYKGEIHGLVLQDPEKMGYEGVKTCVAKLKGEKVPAYVDTGVRLITKDDLLKPDTIRSLVPSIDEWIKDLK